MEKLKVLDLFSGIGGFSIGLERAGMETVAFCEIEPFCHKVLNKHWPDVPIYTDVRELTNERLESDGIRGIDVMCGGFPCQDISVAGNQAGIGEGTRSGLWSECARLLGDIRPKYAIFENVTALLNGQRGDWFKRVLWDISKVGYDAEWHCIPASELGAHHHRDRVWIIAYPEHDGFPAQPELRCNEKASDKRRTDREEISRQLEGESRPLDVHGLRRSDSRSQQRQSKAGRNSGEKEVLADTDQSQCEGGGLSKRIRKEYSNVISTSGWEVEPSVGRVANGVPDHAHRLKALGNAVVPQIPELIGRAINGRAQRD